MTLEGGIVSDWPSRICFSVTFNLKVVLSVPQVRDICDSISKNMVYSPVALRMVVPNWCHKKNCFHQQGLLLTYSHLKLYGSIKMYHRVRINMNCFMILTFESVVLTWPLAFPQDKCVLLFSRNLLRTLKYWKSNCTFPPFFMSPFSCQTCYLSFPLLTWLFWEGSWWGQGAGGPPSGWPISCSWTSVALLPACFTWIRGHAGQSLSGSGTLSSSHK